MIISQNGFDSRTFENEFSHLSFISSFSELKDLNTSDFIMMTKVGYIFEFKTQLLNAFLDENTVGALYANNNFNSNKLTSIDSFSEVKLPKFINPSLIIRNKFIEHIETLPNCIFINYFRLALYRALVYGEIMLVSNSKYSAQSEILNPYNIDLFSRPFLEIIKSDLILLEEKKQLKNLELQRLIDFSKLYERVMYLRFPNQIKLFILKCVLQNSSIVKYIKNNVIGNLNFYVKDLVNLFRYKVLKKDTAIFTFFTSKYPIHMNWGDDINYFIIEQATGKKVIKLNRLSIGKVIIPIGSIIQFIPKRISGSIYGSGLISSCSSVEKRNIDDIKFVRGPNTRNRLIDLGLEVPASYGDLGLLISDYYHPNIEKTHTVGFIPHYTEKNSDFTIHCMTLGIKIINVQQGHKEFIDDLLSCENILSSSLHGLIASDSFLIPNKWIKVSDRVLGDGFKFDDYHGGVLAENFGPYTPNCNENLNQLLALCNDKKINKEEIKKSEE